MFIIECCRRTTIAGCVGATFQEGAKLTGGLLVRNSARTSSTEMVEAYRPHMTAPCAWMRTQASVPDLISTKPVTLFSPLGVRS